MPSPITLTESRTYRVPQHLGRDVVVWESSLRGVQLVTIPYTKFVSRYHHWGLGAARAAFYRLRGTSKPRVPPRMAVGVVRPGT